MNLPRLLLLIETATALLPLICFERLCLALKCLKPGFWAMTLPLFVTLSLLVNDLFVFIPLEIGNAVAFPYHYL